MLARHLDAAILLLAVLVMVLAQDLFIEVVIRLQLTQVLLYIRDTTSTDIVIDASTTMRSLSC